MYLVAVETRCYRRVVAVRSRSSLGERKKGTELEKKKGKKGKKKKKEEKEEKRKGGWKGRSRFTEARTRGFRVCKQSCGNNYRAKARRSRARIREVFATRQHRPVGRRVSRGSDDDRRRSPRRVSQSSFFLPSRSSRVPVPQFGYQTPPSTRISDDARGSTTRPWLWSTRPSKERHPVNVSKRPPPRLLH